MSEIYDDIRLKRIIEGVICHAVNRVIIPAFDNLE